MPPPASSGSLLRPESDDMPWLLGSSFLGKGSNEHFGDSANPALKNSRVHPKTFVDGKNEQDRKDDLAIILDRASYVNNANGLGVYDADNEDDDGGVGHRTTKKQQMARKMISAWRRGG